MKWPWEKKSNGPTRSVVITKILKTYGGTPVYSPTNYHTMSKEGYNNFVIFACLDHIYRAYNQLDWKVFKKDADGNDEEVKNHPLTMLLKKPNPFQGKSSYNESLIKYWYIGGDVFIQKVVAGGNPKELYALRPDKCKVDFGTDPAEPIKSFIYSAGNEQRIPPEDIMHLKFFNPSDEFNGLGRGLSRFVPVAKSGDMLNASLGWNLALMQNGARPSGAFVSEKELSDPQFDRLNEQLDEEVSGPQNAGETLVLDGGVTWVDMFVNPKDADFIESTKLSMRQIAVGIGVPSILVGDTESTTYANYKEARKALYMDTVIPLGEMVKEEYNVFFEDELNEGEFLGFSTDHILALQEDVSELYKRVNESVFLSINQKLQQIGKDTIGPVGDSIVSGNYAVVDGKLLLPMNLVLADTSPAPPPEPKPKDEEEKAFIY